MSTVEKFKFWANKILPLVYDDSLSYYEFLCKVHEKLNETIDAVNDNTAAIAEFDQRITQFMQDERLARQNWESAEALKWAAFQAMFINAYDPEEEYVIGDICSQGMKMYVANAATTGTFDPTKWDEIVLADYLAEYVADAKSEMQGQYDDFLEDYQRQFGIANAFGTSTTDAISQDFFTKNAVTLKGQYTTVVGTDVLDTTAPVGLYGVSAAQAATLTNTPTDFASAQCFIWVITSAIHIIIQEKALFVHYRNWQTIKSTDTYGNSSDLLASQKMANRYSVGYKGSYVTTFSTNVLDSSAYCGLWGFTSAQAATLTNTPPGFDTSKSGFVWVIAATVHAVLQNNNFWIYFQNWQQLGAAKWSDKKWIALGDSLTEVNSRATTNYISYITTWTGVNAVNMGLSGTGYMKRSDHDQAFYQRAANMATDADVITIFGSGNDLSIGSSQAFPIGDITDTTTDTICGCINTTLDVIINKYVTAGKIPQIGIIAPTPWYTSGHDYTPLTPNNRMDQYVEKLKGICERRGIPFLDLFHASNLHPESEAFRAIGYSHDEGNGIHPDENGHKIIAPMIEAFIDSLI